MSDSIILRPVHVNHEDFRLISDIGFCDEHVLKRIEEIIEQDTWLKLLCKTHARFNPYTDKQHRMWFGGIVSPILRHYKVPMNAINAYALHYELKKKYFPAGEIQLGHVLIPAVQSITTMGKEEMSEAIDDVINAYSMLGIDFNSRLLRDI